MPENQASLLPSKNMVYFGAKIYILLVKNMYISHPKYIYFFTLDVIPENNPNVVFVYPVADFYGCIANSCLMYRGLECFISPLR